MIRHNTSPTLLYIKSIYVHFLSYLFCNDQVNNNDSKSGEFSFPSLTFNKLHFPETLIPNTMQSSV